MSIYEFGNKEDKKYERAERHYLLLGNAESKTVDYEKKYPNNIAEKNQWYCELTGYYVLFQNNFTDSFFGIEHYRRFFSGNNRFCITSKEINAILQKKEIILPTPQRIFTNVFDDYCVHHFCKDIEEIRDIIIDCFPDYALSFEALMKSDHFSPYNMLICKKNYFFSYCEWLFSILKMFETKTNIESYSKYQKRVFGFLSERLLNVWVRKNIDSSKICYKPVVFNPNGNKSKASIKDSLKAKILSL